MNSKTPITSPPRKSAVFILLLISFLLTATWLSYIAFTRYDEHATCNMFLGRQRAILMYTKVISDVVSGYMGPIALSFVENFFAQGDVQQFAEKTLGKTKFKSGRNSKSETLVYGTFITYYENKPVAVKGPLKRLFITKNKKFVCKDSLLNQHLARQRRLLAHGKNPENILSETIPVAGNPTLFSTGMFELPRGRVFYTL